MTHRLFATAMAAALTASTGLTGCASPPMGEGDRIERLTSSLTFDEKLALVSGDKDIDDPTVLSQGAVGAIRPIPRLGIPALTLTDGPAGVRSLDRTATALPAPVALAASFDETLARRYGAVLGREARAIQQNVVLSPMLNIVRSPYAGRNFETLGEDPVLTARLGAAQISGIQAQGVMANAKHFALNNQEANRFEVIVDIDERAAREIYLPAFRRAAEAEVATIMCAYNRIGGDLGDGSYACATPKLLTMILRDEWGYDGVVMSDWYAAIPDSADGTPQPTSEPYLAGMDVEMPNSAMAAAMKDDIAAGRAEESDLDPAVRRVLQLYERFGRLSEERPATTSLAELAADHAQAAYDIAVAGAVLLENRGAILPLNETEARKTLFVGPTLASLNYGGGGSSRVKTQRRQAPLDAIAQALGARPAFALGIDLDGEAIPQAAFEFTAIEGVDGAVETIDFGAAQPIPAGAKSRFEGLITAQEDGLHDIRLQASNGIAKVMIFDGTTALAVLDTGGAITASNSVVPTRDDMENVLARLPLEKGRSYRFTLEAEAGKVGSRSFEVADPDAPMRLRLAWQTPSDRSARLEEAVRMASSNEVETVVVAAFDEGIEGVDRTSLTLPHEQDTLISALAATGKRVAVVLNTGGAVLMPWADKVDGIVQIWYPGQEGGRVISDLLLGRAEPGGRLPMSFPVGADDWPGASAAALYPGENGRVSYKEGREVGYRWHAATGRASRYPFGHGLGYSKVEFLDPRIGLDAVSLTVANTGIRATTSVPQIYLGAPEPNPDDVQPIALAGFAKVALQPGQSKRVTIEFDDLPLRFWSVEQNTWQPVTGKRPVYLGRSASDLILVGFIGGEAP